MRHLMNCIASHSFALSIVAGVSMGCEGTSSSNNPDLGASGKIGSITGSGGSSKSQSPVQEGAASSVVKVGGASLSGGAGSSSLGIGTNSTAAAAGNRFMVGSGGTQVSSGASGAPSPSGRPNSTGGKESTGGTVTFTGSTVAAGASSAGSQSHSGGSNVTGVGSIAGAAGTGGTGAAPPCHGPTAGTCPPADDIQANCVAYGGYTCGCYVLEGLGATKKAILDAAVTLPDTDAEYVQQYIASAMMETERLDSNYPPGDNKTGDWYSAGAAKQNWLMMRQCHRSWAHLEADDYLMADAVNGDRALDIQVYAECRRLFGDSWWAGQRSGATGLDSPDTDYVHVFEAVFDWMHQMLQNDTNGNSHYCDDVRFWVDKIPF